MNIEKILPSVVAIRASIPDDAYTANTLGTKREGSGVVIGDSGLVLTIGYLITEAEEVWLTRHDGRVVAAHPMAYDQATGFGLVQALGPLDLPAIEIGRSDKVKLGDPVVLADGAGDAVEANIIAKQEFAGYWEYLLGRSDLHRAGAFVVGRGGTGRCRGKADRPWVAAAADRPKGRGRRHQHGGADRPSAANPGRSAAARTGQQAAAAVARRVHGRERRGRDRLRAGAWRAGGAGGMRPGDIISEIRNSEVDGLADLYRKIWSSGPVGTELPMRIVRDGRETWLRLKSGDRGAYLKKPQMQ